MDRHLPFEDELTALLPRLRRFAHALARSPSDADDLTQMTVERAIRSRSQWQPGTRLDSWLYRIMRNIWIDTVRSRARKEKFEAPPEEADSIGVDATFARGAARSRGAHPDRRLRLSGGGRDARSSDRHGVEPVGARPSRAPSPRG